MYSYIDGVFCLDFSGRSARLNRFKDFFLHLDWLLDTHHDLQDHGICKCKKIPPPPKAPERTAGESVGDVEDSNRKRKHPEIAETDNVIRKRAKDGQPMTQAEMDEETRQYAQEMMAADQEPMFVNLPQRGAYDIAFYRANPCDDPDPLG
jgi:hypothetical protein